MWVDWIDSTGDMAWARKDPQSGWNPIAYEEYESVEDRDFNARKRIRLQTIQ